MRLFAIFIAFSSLFSTKSLAVDRFVDGLNGSDSNNGQTLATAWKTIQKAANSAPAGAAVFIRGGTYFEEIWMNVSGSAAAGYTVFQPYQSEVVTIDGGATGTGAELFVIDAKHHVRLQNLRFANATGNFSIGFIAQNGAHHIDVVGCEFFNIHFSNNPAAPVNSSTNVNPLIIYGTSATQACSDIFISGCEVRDCRTGFSEALTLSGNVDGFVVENCHVHDITNIGIDCAGGYGVCSNPVLDASRNGVVRGCETDHCMSNYAVSAGIYVDGGQNIVIERNRSHHNGRGFEVGCEQAGRTASGIVVRDNLSYQNLEAGIGIGGYNFPTTGKVANSHVLNNTFYANVESNNGDGELLVEYTENCSVKQNIFFATNAAKLLVVTRLPSMSLALNFNHFWLASGAATAKFDWQGVVHTGFSAYKTATGQDAASLFSNPNLADVAGLDFALTASSPSVNAGDPTFSPASGETDFSGAARVIGPKVDLGAFEFQTPLAVEWTDFRAETCGPDSGSACLFWATASERDVDFFEIQRSRDGFLFEKIGIEKAQNRASAYRFFDPKAAEKADGSGRVFYRLFEKTSSGAGGSVSKIVALEFEKPLFELWPNPTDGPLFWRKQNSDAGGDSAMIFDEKGQLVGPISFGADGAARVDGLAAGIYFLKIEGLVVGRFVKK